MAIQFGTSIENGRLISPVGMNIKAQEFYPEFPQYQIILSLYYRSDDVKPGGCGGAPCRGCDSV